MADIFKFGIAGLAVGVAGALAYSKFSGPIDITPAVKNAAYYNVTLPPLIKQQYNNRITGGIPIEYQPEDPDIGWTMPDWNAYVEPVENVIYNKTPFIPISSAPAKSFRGIQPVGSYDRPVVGRYTYF